MLKNILGVYIMAVKVNEENFEKEVLKSDIPVMTVFYADWIAACKLIAPFIEEIDRDYAGKVKVAMVDVEEIPNISRKYYLHRFPTVMMFKNGEITWTVVGYRPRKTFIEMANS